MIERFAWIMVCAFVFTLPWEKSVSVPGIGTLTRLAGIAALCGGAGAAYLRRRVRLPNLALVLAALFVIWTGLSWFWSYDQPATADRLFTFVQLLVMTYLLWDQCRTPERQTALMTMYVAGSVVASLATIVRFGRGLETYYRRYAAAGFDPNDLGLTVALAIPLALYLAMTARDWRAWLCRLAIVVISIAILLTASRTALIAAVLGFAFPLWTWSRSDFSHRVASIGLLAFLISGSMWLAPAASRARIATLGTELARGTLHNRTQIWKAGLRALKRRPVHGVGSGAYPEAVKPWLGVPGRPGHEYVAHNTFLSVLVETGAIGFTLYAALLATLVVFVYMMPDVERALWAVLLVVWAAGAATLTWEQRKPTWLLFALIMTGWAWAFRPRRESS